MKKEQYLISSPGEEISAIQSLNGLVWKTWQAESMTQLLIRKWVVSRSFWLLKIVKAFYFRKNENRN